LPVLADNRGSSWAKLPGFSILFPTDDPVAAKLDYGGGVLTVGAGSLKAVVSLRWRPGTATEGEDFNLMRQTIAARFPASGPISITTVPGPDGTPVESMRRR